MARKTPTYLAEGIEDGVALCSSSNWGHSLHLRDRSGSSRHNVSEATDDLREGTLADDDEGAVDDGDALCWGLKGLRLLGDHLDVGDDLSGGGLRGDSGYESRGEEVAEKHDWKL